MKKIWNKSGDGEVNTLVEKYTVGNDYILDMKLLKYDIRASKAHAQMLQKIGILENNELKDLNKGLGEIEILLEKGEFTIDISQEDGHTAIESYLTEHYGEVGKKIHTGRSRNDQALVMMRLYSLDVISQIEQQIQKLIEVLEEKIQEIGDIKMPGYTHMQRAMPTSVGVWMGSYRDTLYDDLVLLEAAKQVNNQNPLGSAAGYGEDVFGLDRDLVSKQLGFKKTQKNPIYCAYSRGKFEHIIMQALSQVMMDMGKFANELVIFSTSEFDFFTLPDEFKTGSSIMPQKKNWDIVELIRGNTNIFLGYEFQVREVYKMLFLGYNRDFQLTKQPYMKSVELTQNTLEICNCIVGNLGVKTENIESACSPELYATKEAYELVKEGMSFRDAYQKVGQKYL